MKPLHFLGSQMLKAQYAAVRVVGSEPINCVISKKILSNNEFSDSLALFLFLVTSVIHKHFGS